MSQTAKRLRELIAAPAIVAAPGCYDGLTARLAEQAGFPAICTETRHAKAFLKGNRPVATACLSVG